MDEDDNTIGKSNDKNNLDLAIPSVCDEVINNDIACLYAQTQFDCKPSQCESIDTSQYGMSSCNNNLSNVCSQSKLSQNTKNLTESACVEGEPSKQRLQSTKRRAGILYKQLCSSSKLLKVSSKYFNQAHNTQKRWIPPRSPYALVQEDLFDKPWQLLVATIFLTKTAAKRALPELHKFLDRFPRPEDVLQANYEEIDKYFKPLGLTNTRSHTIMRFTVEYLEKDWKYPCELYGIGKYGDDSYRMFCINEWRQVSPDDIPLSMYRNWLLEHAKKLGID